MDSIATARASNRISAVERGGAPLTAWAVAILVAVSGFAILAVPGSRPPPSAAVTDARTEELKSRAEVMQRRCGRTLHHDADEFGECFEAVLAEAAGEPAAVRFALAYRGWVEASSAARISLPGAADAARHALERFRCEQAAAGIADSALCVLVEGACAPRLAAIAQAEEPVAQAPRAACASAPGG